MKKQKFVNYDREKKIHRVVKGNKQNKYKKQFLHYDIVDEVPLYNESSKSSKQK